MMTKMKTPHARQCALSKAREQGFILLTSAVSLTVLLGFLGFAVDVGYLQFQKRWEATRYALAHGTKYPVSADNLTTFVKNEAIGLDPSAITVTPTWSDTNHVPGTSVQVQYAFQPIAPYMPTGLLTLSSTSKMLISQ